MVEKEKLDVRTGAVVPDLSHPHRRLWRYGPLIIWAALIFIGSSNVLSASNTSILVRAAHWVFPTASDATLGALHFMARKAGHFTEYAVLGLLAARAFRTSSRALLRNRWFWCALLFVVAYSLSDEFHQSLVPSRGASLYDSLIDSLGGLTALALLLLRTRRKHGQDLPD